MEKYVTSLELAQKLKANGYPQVTYWFIRLQKPTGLTKLYWKGDMDYDNECFSGSSLEHVRFREENEFFAAPLSDELLEQLPKQIPVGESVYYLGIGWPPKSDTFVASYSNAETNEVYATTDKLFDNIAIKRADTLPDALAQLWLWCKENGDIK